MSYAYIAANFASTTLASAITTTSQTSVTVTDGSQFPSPTNGDWTLVTLENESGTREVICVVGRSSNTFTVGVPGSAAANSAGRGYDSSTATTWAAGDAAEVRPVAGLMEDAVNLAERIAAATDKATPVDADVIGIHDSAAAATVSPLKKVTWANIKATIKTYADTLYLALAGGTLTGKLIFKAGLNNVASAATVDLTAATSNTAHITGTTGISAFTMTSGQVIDLVFDGVLTLTHHATNNNLLGGVDVTTAANDRARYWYDGTTVWCVAYQRASGTALVAASEAPPVRQTVLSGPVDSSGLPNFGGATGSTTVSATGTLKATAAAGGSADYTGSIVDPSWTGLSTNGTMYLYLDITSAGVVTTGSTTLAPTYQWGGTYSTTSNQHTFNIQEMTMKAGDGGAANQVYRVFVGEVTVSGSVVTAITWYALMGRYYSTSSSVPSNAVVSKSHNLGVVPQKFNITMRNVTTELGYAAGEEVSAAALKNSAIQNTGGAAVSRLAMQYGSDTTNLYLPAKTTGANTIITNGNWGMGFFADRGW